jgi:hypothetical protein
MKRSRYLLVQLYLLRQSEQREVWWLQCVRAWPHTMKGKSNKYWFSNVSWVSRVSCMVAPKA